MSASVVRWAERVPDRVCLSFSTGGAPTEELTYADLARRAATQAGLFRTEGLRPGDAVVILGHSTPAFVTALLGAQAAGLLAVPCPPPEPLEDGQPLVDRRIGEVAIRGDSVMSGYLSGTEGEGALSEDGLLRTGDLGYLVGGELFLVGRKKDLIIRAGRNYYPQDMEEALAPIAGLRAGRAVAFAVPGEESERLVLAAERRPESEGDEPALRAAIRDAVRAAAGIAPDDIVIVAPQTLPLTSSGKVMRPEARRLYMAGRLKG